MPIRTIVLCLASLLALPAAAQAPKPEAKPAAKPSAEGGKPPAELLLRTAKKAECVVKPVMSDNDLRNCGARAPMQYEKPR